MTARRALAPIVFLVVAACAPSPEGGAPATDEPGDGARDNGSGEVASNGTAEGGVEIEYVAHASFRLRDEHGTELLIDPFASRVWLGYDWPTGIEPDAVLITHPHYDHDAGRYRGTPFPWGEGTAVVDAPGSHRFGDFVVSGIEGKHADPYGMEFGQLNTIMVIEAYGLRIAHLGDNGPLTEDMVRGLGRVDVLMLPADGVDHIISKETTAEILATVDPRIVIPMHYRHPDLEPTADGPGDLGEIEPWLEGRDRVGRVRSHRTVVSVPVLPERREILVLDHAPYVTRPEG